MIMLIHFHKKINKIWLKIGKKHIIIIIMLSPLTTNSGGIIAVCMCALQTTVHINLHGAVTFCCCATC